MGRYLAALFTLVYLAFPTRQYYWDGVSFAIDIEHAASWRELFRVHHLLYNLLGYAEYRLLGRSVRALYLLQWTNCLAGGLLVWLAHRLFRSLGVPAGSAAACAALLGVAATFWKFTTDADSYILATLLLLAAYVTIPRSPALGALFQLGAVMMHQLGALFFPVAMVLLWQRSRERFWRDAAVYTILTAGGTLALYALAYRLVRPLPAPSFTAWLTFHADIPFSFAAARNAGWLLLGTLRLFVGGKPSRTLYFIVPLVAVLLIAAAWKVKPRLVRPAIRLPGALLVWLAVYLVFLFFWEPNNTFYRLFYLVPLIAALGVATRALPVRTLALIVLALASWNFAQFIYPNTRVEANAPLQVALSQQRLWPSGTGVVYGRFVPDLWTISYFNPQVSWIAVERPDSARVAALAADFARQSGKVYLDWTYRENAGLAAARFSFQPVLPEQRPASAPE
jgi:hypothetical protein